MPGRVGNQRPTFTTAPDEVDGRGARAVSVLEHYGVRFYGSQKYEFDRLMARTAYDDFASKAIYISKPRQNGKSFAVRFYCIWCACVLGMKVLYTAHRVRTSRKMFKEIADFVLAYSDFRKTLIYPQGIYRAPGYEGVYFTDPKTGRAGGYIEFMTRTSGVRGDTADVIVIDEAQEMTAEQEEALLPTSVAGSDVSRKLSQQVVYIGTPPDAKTKGTVFQSAHDKAHVGVLYGAWWIEWAVDAPIEPGDKEAVLSAIYATNPALGYRIREDTLLERWAKMTPEGFAREHLGWWADYRKVNLMIPAELWSSAASSKRAPDGIRAFAVKFDPTGERAALAVGVRPKEGPARIELVNMYDTGHGLEQIAQDLMKVAPRASEIVIDGGGFAQTLCERLIMRGLTIKQVRKPTALEVSTAASYLVAALNDGTVTHYESDGQRLLDDSATKTERRQVGRQGGYSFKSTEEAFAEPIEAAALALLFAMKTKKDPTKKAVIV